MSLRRLDIFLWRAVSGAVAPLAGLFSRKSAPSPLCPICKNAEESVLHMLLLCPWVVPVWFGGPLGIRINWAGISSFGIWLRRMAEMADRRSDGSRFLSIIAFSCWQIWKARCSFVFCSKKVDPWHAVHAISLCSTSFWPATFKDVCISRPILHSNSSIAHWRPPEDPYCKLNVDASWHPATGRALLAAVLGHL
ncbi:hypothetical protein ACFX1Z_036582 [Malus domestica]